MLSSGHTREDLPEKDTLGAAPRVVHGRTVSRSESDDSMDYSDWRTHKTDKVGKPYRRAITGNAQLSWLSDQKESKCVHEYSAAPRESREKLGATYA